MTRSTSAICGSTRRMTDTASGCSAGSRFWSRTSNAVCFGPKMAVIALGAGAVPRRHHRCCRPGLQCGRSPISSTPPCGRCNGIPGWTTFSPPWVATAASGAPRMVAVTGRAVGGAGLPDRPVEPDRTRGCAGSPGAAVCGLRLTLRVAAGSTVSEDGGRQLGAGQQSTAAWLAATWAG